MGSKREHGGEHGDSKRSCPPSSRPRDLVNCLESLGGSRGTDSGAISNLLNFSPGSGGPGSATGSQASANTSPGLHFLSGFQGSPTLGASPLVGQAAGDNNAALYQSIQALLQRHGVDTSNLTRDYAMRMMQPNTAPPNNHTPMSPMGFNSSPAGFTAQLGLPQVPAIQSQAFSPLSTLSTLPMNAPYPPTGTRPLAAAHQSLPYHSSMLNAARLADAGIASPMPVLQRPFSSADLALLPAFNLGMGVPALHQAPGSSAKKERRAESVSSSRSQKEGARSHGPSTGRSVVLPPCQTVALPPLITLTHMHLPVFPPWHCAMPHRALHLTLHLALHALVLTRRGADGNRYKNRWTDDEVQSLRLGMARFGKHHQASSQRSDKASRRERGESSASGEAESVWEQILAVHTPSHTTHPPSLLPHSAPPSLLSFYRSISLSLTL